MKIALVILLLTGVRAKFKILLYEHANFNGVEKVVTSPTNLPDISFNDAVTSLKVESGDWELYEHDNYWGRRMLVHPGARINVDHNDFYSSVRPVCRYDKDENVSKLVLYEHASQQGQNKTCYVDNSNFGKYNDIFSSAFAEKGDWELYEHANFQGKRTTLKHGEQRNLNQNDFYSSARPICSSYRKRSKCSIKRIEVVDDGKFKPQLVGTKVIASNSAASCDGPGTHQLSIEYADRVDELMTLEISESDELNWSVTSSMKVKTSVKVFGSGGSVEAGISAGVGGSYTATVTNSKSFSEGSETVVGHATTYTTPGGAIVYGIVDQYKMDRSKTPVKLHLECLNEDDYVKDSTVELKAITYLSASFWPLTGRFSAAACAADPYIKDCVTEVQRKYSHYFGNKTMLTEAFYECFQDNSNKCFEETFNKCFEETSNKCSED